MALTFKPGVILTLLLVTLVLLALTQAYPFRGSKQVRVRRQSFFRCSGWGAGCSNLDHKQRRPHPTLTLTSQPISSPSRLHSSSPRLLYGPPYFFTSGGSWGAIGKRGGKEADPHIALLDSRSHRLLLLLHFLAGLAPPDDMRL